MQLSPSDADMYGVSIVTSTDFRETRGRRGSIYDAARLAGGDLFHVHRMPDGSTFLAVFGTSWTNATPSGLGWTGWTERTTPTLWRIDALGLCEPVVDRGAGMLQSPVLAGATSVGSRLFVLRRGQGGMVVLSVYDTRHGDVLLDRDIMLPGVQLGSDLVSWSAGLFYDGDDVVVLGTPPSGAALYAMRVDADSPALFSEWGYACASGWTKDAQQIFPIHSGTSPISSATPVSVTRVRNRLVMTTTQVASGSASAWTWSTPHSLFGSWMLGDVVTLGPAAELMSGIRLQSDLHANPGNGRIADSAQYTDGVPYCFSSKTSTKISTQWDVLPIAKTGSR